MKEYDKALETYEKGLEHEPGSAELQEGAARRMHVAMAAREPGSRRASPHPAPSRPRRRCARFAARR